MQYREVQFHGLITLPRLSQVPIIRMTDGSICYQLHVQTTTDHCKIWTTYIGNLAISDYFYIKGEHFETTHFRNATCSKLMFFLLICSNFTKIDQGC